MTRQRLRPSQIITTFGPGSIVDLPDDSVMIAGTEHWFDGYKVPRRISEPRLQTALRVVEFRTPPVGSYQEKDVPFVRFPRWRVCPKCERLSNDFRFPKRGDLELPPVPRCDKCNKETYPARLIVACAKGHIDDFPWYRWLHRGQNCGGGNNLYLRGEGKSAALSDLRIECTCGITPRTLAGAMSREAMSECGVRCSRKRPWLNDDPDAEDCGETKTRLYVLQRGASNVYFSVVRSASSIPPWSDPLQAEVASWWSQFRTPLPPAVLSEVIKSSFPATPEERIRDCIARLEGLKTERPSIRREEYDVFNADKDQATEYFEARRQELSEDSSRYVDRLVAVSRLREVRALLGFPVRTTYATATQMIQGAAEEIIVVGYVFTEGASALVKLLATAQTDRRVQVTIVGNRMRDQLPLLMEMWPTGVPLPPVFSREPVADDPMAALHAKLLVCDRTEALVGTPVDGSNCRIAGYGGKAALMVDCG